MRITVYRNSEGVTLVEVMVALVVALLVSLALMQTALLGIDSNMKNVLRDEAVRIAEKDMNDARNLPFDSLNDSTSTVLRSFKNIDNFQYNVSRTVTVLDTNYVLNSTLKRVDVTVTWDWKENTVANGNPFTHTITSIIKRPVQS
jgi:type IV pilus assembly protein PilV